MSDTEPKLQPCLAELLRTCMKPESMILQVDGLVAQETTVDLADRPSTSAKTITRFQLTDGELRIQALLPPVVLSHHDLKVGDRIDVRDFVVRKARRLNGSGKVIYLHIRDFVLANQHSTNTNTKAWNGEGGFVKSDAEEDDNIEPSPKRRKRNTNRVAFAGLPDPASDDSQRGEQQPEADRQAPSHTRNGSMTTNDDAESESEDEFESVHIDLPQVQQRRQTLHTVRQAGAPAAASPSAVSEQPEPPSRQRTTAPEQRHDPTTQSNHETPPTATAKQRSSSSSSPPPPIPSLPLPLPIVVHNPPPLLTPPYHPLSSLLSPHLPSRNYPLTTLAIITSVSSTLILPTKRNSPFPAKRNIRILDPSLSLCSQQTPSQQHPSHHPQGFSLAIYVDAKSFLPHPGTIALFRGIVMQKFNREIILNAYATLKDKPADNNWYIHDEQVLEDMGFDVKGMRRWWEERVSRNVRKSPGS